LSPPFSRPTMAMRALPIELLGTASVPRLILLALADWVAVSAIWILAPRTPSWTYPIWIFLLAGRFHALGVVLHDAVHMPQTRKTFAVRVLEIMAGYPIGSTIEAMRYHHLRHHRDLGLSGDPYLKPWVGKGEFRFWVVSLGYLLLVPLWILRGFYGFAAASVVKLRHSYGRLFLQDRSGDDLTKSAEVIACAREDRWQSLFYVGSWRLGDPLPALDVDDVHRTPGCSRLFRGLSFAGRTQPGTEGGPQF
jgi:fatty acid desaturase